MCGIFGKLLNTDDIPSLINAGYSIKNRGPERTITHHLEDAFLMFHRLAIINTSPLLDQPHIYKSKDERDTYYYVLCNGEIYNYQTLSTLYLDNMKLYNDTSVIFPLFEALDYDFIKLNNELNGEYSIVICKVKNNKIKECWMSTDPYSVRPLFVYIKENTAVFSSLLRGLTSINEIRETKEIKRLNGGQYIHLTFKDNKVYSENNGYYTKDLSKIGLLDPITDIEEAKLKLMHTLENSVVRRLTSDRPIGCLLSGGLDSSLVAAIASMEMKNRGMKLRTFSIGMEGGTDLKYARLVADHIDSEHTEVIFTPEEGLSVLEDVIKTCETYDTTTIRASVGQYLLARWISQNTNIKVVLNGDGADECMMGYLYNYYSPSHIDSHNDCLRLLDEIHLYDGLRVDRNISRWGLEARVPYLDKSFSNLCKLIHPKLKMPFMKCKEFPEGRIEKWLIRSAFEKYKLLPNEVLWRIKEAFSDGVSKKENSWYSIIQQNIGDEKEWYREVFIKEFGENALSVIPHYWMPKWVNATDPSARILSVYTK